MFLKLVQTSLLILLVLFFITPVGSPTASRAAIVAGFSLLGVAGAYWTSKKELPTQGPDELAADYRASFFLGLALAQAGLLISFVLTFVWDGL